MSNIRKKYEVKEGESEIVERMIQQRAVEVLFRNSSITLLALTFMSSWIAGILLIWVPLLDVALWFGSLVLLSTFRIAHMQLFLHSDTKNRNYKRALSWFAVGVSGTAIIWSISLIFFERTNGDEFLFFFSIVTAGVAAAAISSLSYIPKMYIFFTGFLLVPLAAYFISLGDPAKVSIGLSFILYWGFLCAIAYRYMKTLTNSWRLELDNQVLADFLVKKHEAVQLKNTELLRVIDELEDANEVKNSFLATVSHEIRTPMNGLLGMFDLLIDTDLNEQQVEYLKTASGSAESLLHLVDDLLDFSKYERGTLSIEKIRFQPYSIADEVCQIARSRAQSKGVEVLFEWADSMDDTYLGDPTRFRQILSNLVGNAVKFTESGFVRLALTECVHHESGSTLSFEVEDSGIGIQSIEGNDIFEPFIQADGSMNRKYGGTGLGLSISKQLIEMMGGSIRYMSDLGKGSTFLFSISLERVIEDEFSPRNRSFEVQWKQLRFSGKVLVVEDDLVNQKVVARLLEKLGFQVSLAVNGADGIEQFKMDDWDLVLMDYQMPLMNGLEATCKIREWELLQKKKPTTIVALTANARDKDKEACTEAGMDGFLPKPIRAKVLTESLCQWLDPID